MIDIYKNHTINYELSQNIIEINIIKERKE